MYTPNRANSFRGSHNDFSRSPVGRTYVEHDDKNLKEQYHIRRDVSADTMGNKNHYFSQSDTPFLNGRKNKVFDNPSLRSSNIFYEHNYGYVNDMPNDRLLTPVKHDRHRTASVDPNASLRDSRPPLTPNKTIRIEDEYRGRDIQPRNLHEQYNDFKKQERRQSQQQQPDNHQEERRGSRRDSVRSQQPVPRAVQQKEEPVNIRDDVSEANGNRVNSRNSFRNENYGYNRRDNEDDNKSTVSKVSGGTIVSHLSCDDYRCPKCFNQQLGRDKRALSAVERARDKELQGRINQHNARVQALEDEKDIRQRQDRLNIGRQQKAEIDRKYNEKLDDRRSPSRECGDQGFRQIFDQQEEYRYREKVNGVYYRDELKSQMREREDFKKYQKELEQRPYSVSIDLTEDYYFKKHSEDKQHVLDVLRNQVEDKQRRKEEELAYDKIETLQRTEEARRKQQDEDRRAADKHNRQKRELQKSYHISQEEKYAKQKEEQMNKAVERHLVDNGYSEFKRREHDNQVKIRSQYRDFLSTALSKQVKPSYRKLYEERKQHKEATSFDPRRKQVKKVYPCGECNQLFEKVHLTKMV